jgi:hypothetical protein
MNSILLEASLVRFWFTVALVMLMMGAWLIGALVYWWLGKY